MEVAELPEDGGPPSRDVPFEDGKSPFEDTPFENGPIKRTLGEEYFYDANSILRFPPLRQRSVHDTLLTNICRSRERRLDRASTIQKRFKALMFAARRHLAFAESSVKKEKDSKERQQCAAQVIQSVNKFWASVDAQINATKEIQIQDQKKKDLHKKQIASLEYTEAILKERVKFQLGDGKIPKLRLLENIGRGLRVYQKIGIEWLMSLHDQCINGILADEMGLGKTVQTIAFFTYLAEHRGDWGTHLIVVPMSILLNWENEFRRWAPSFNVLAYYGTAKERAEKRKGWESAVHYNAVIVSYNTLLKDKRIFRRKRWHYLVLDEAHAIKSWETQRWQVLLDFSTEHRLLLSGTPLQNNPMELWSLLHFLMPDSIVFESYEDFKVLYGNPVVSLDVLHRLHQTLRPFLLRRLKCDVEKQLPKKVEKIIMCPLSKRQRTLYDEYMALEETRKVLASRDTLSILGVLIALRKVCNHPNLFQQRPTESPFIVEESVSRTMRKTLPGKIYFAQHSLPVEIWSESRWLRHDAHNLEKLRLEMAQEVPVPVEAMEAVDEGLPSCFDVYTRQFRKTEESAALERVQNVQSSNRATLHRICSWPALPYVSILRERHIPESLILKNQISQSLQPMAWTVHKALAVDTAQSSIDSSTSNSALQRICTPFQVEKCVAHPSKDMLQYDSGKLQTLAKLLPKLRSEGHKCLIFTQFTKVLNILEEFLTTNSLTYFRLDGSTHVRKRQHDVDAFNTNDRIFAFILSTRSGGLGLNLIGADTVIFYDSDWNPAIDVQAQDRCHRIGQQRDVTIYRLISEFTVEEKILLRAREKKKMNNIVMRAGGFETVHTHNAPEKPDAAWKDSVLDFFHEFDEDFNGGKGSRATQFESCLQRVEDEEDAVMRTNQKAEEEDREIEIFQYAVALRQASTHSLGSSMNGTCDTQTGESTEDSKALRESFYLSLQDSLGKLNAQCRRVGRVALIRHLPGENHPLQYFVSFCRSVDMDALASALLAHGLISSRKDISCSPLSKIQRTVSTESELKQENECKTTASGIESSDSDQKQNRDAEISKIQWSVSNESEHEGDCKIVASVAEQTDNDQNRATEVSQIQWSVSNESEQGGECNITVTNVGQVDNDLKQNVHIEIGKIPRNVSNESGQESECKVTTSDDVSTSDDHKQSVHSENKDFNNTAEKKTLPPIPSYPNSQNSRQFVYIIEPKPSVTKTYVLSWLKRAGLSAHMLYHEWKQSWLPRTIRIAFASADEAKKMLAMQVLKDRFGDRFPLYSFVAFDGYSKRMFSRAKRHSTEPPYAPKRRRAYS